MEKNFKVGDKVLFRSYDYNDNIATIVSIEPNKVKQTRFSTFTTDCTISVNGNTKDVKFADIYVPNERTIKIFGMKKWYIKGVKENNGYFGAFSTIEKDGKKAVVFCDDRDAIVRVVTDWYDDIFAVSWDGDYRWNHDKPCVVFDNEKGYALNAPHVNNVISEWCEEITPKWCYDKNVGDYVRGIKDGCEVLITSKGNIIKAETANPKNYENVLKTCKSMTNEEVVTLWIENGLPCAHIRGMEYKGASPKRITKENALEMFKTHHTFNGMFNSAEWRILNGEVTLLMRDYADSDYD
jgi:hypothetical protein